MSTAAQSDFVPGSAFSNLKLCLMDKNKHDGYHILHTLTKNYSRPNTKLCIAASQSEISDFGIWQFFCPCIAFHGCGGYNKPVVLVFYPAGTIGGQKRRSQAQSCPGTISCLQ